MIYNYRVLPRVVASQALRMSCYCDQITFGIAFPTFYSIVSGGQNNLSGGKRRLSGGWGQRVCRTLHVLWSPFTHSVFMYVCLCVCVCVCVCVRVREGESKERREGKWREEQDKQGRREKEIRILRKKYSLVFSKVTWVSLASHSTWGWVASLPY